MQCRTSGVHMSKANNTVTDFPIVYQYYLTFAHCLRYIRYSYVGLRGVS
jgi:hypothetical protein